MRTYQWIIASIILVLILGTGFCSQQSNQASQAHKKPADDTSLPDVNTLIDQDVPKEGIVEELEDQSKSKDVLIVEQQGDVYYTLEFSKNKEDWIPLDDNLDLSTGYLHTALQAFCILKTNTGLVLRIDENSTVNLADLIIKTTETHVRSRMILIAGSIQIDYKGRPNETVEAITPSVVIGVRGTNFVVTAEPNDSGMLESIIWVEEGTVEVQPNVDLEPVKQLMEQEGDQEVLREIEAVVTERTSIGASEYLAISATDVEEIEQTIQTAQDPTKRGEIAQQIRRKRMQFHKASMPIPEGIKQASEELRSYQRDIRQQRGRLLIRGGAGTEIRVNGEPVTQATLQRYVQEGTYNIEIVKEGEVILQQDVKVSEGHTVRIVSPEAMRPQAIPDQQFQRIQQTQERELNGIRRHIQQRPTPEQIQQFRERADRHRAIQQQRLDRTQPEHPRPSDHQTDQDNTQQNRQTPENQRTEAQDRRRSTAVPQQNRADTEANRRSNAEAERQEQMRENQRRQIEQTREHARESTVERTREDIEDLRERVNESRRNNPDATRRSSQGDPDRQRPNTRQPQRPQEPETPERPRTENRRDTDNQAQPRTNQKENRNNRAERQTNREQGQEPQNTTSENQSEQNGNERANRQEPQQNRQGRHSVRGRNNRDD